MAFGWFVWDRRSSEPRTLVKRLTWLPQEASKERSKQ
jgi:hypothetical protein